MGYKTGLAFTFDDKSKFLLIYWLISVTFTALLGLDFVPTLKLVPNLLTIGYWLFDEGDEKAEGKGRAPVVPSI